MNHQKENAMTMTGFFIHNLKVFAWFLFPALIVWWFFGMDAAVDFYTICASVWIVLHLIQVGLLLRWLARPKISTVPTGIGVWQHIFNTLSRQAKSRKKRKKEINTVLQRLYRTADAMSEGMIMLTADGQVDWMNRQAMTHFGIDGEAWRHAESGQPDLPFALLRVIDRGIYDEVSKITIGQDASEHIVAVHLLPFDDKNNMLISRDVTKQEAMGRARSEFVRQMATELSLPLEKLDQDVANWAAADVKQTTKTHQEAIRHDLQRMHRLLDDLVTLAMLETGRKEEEKEAVNLSVLCQELLHDAQQLSQQRHEISATIEENNWVFGIEADLRVALWNIVRNAIAYTAAGGTIRIQLLRYNDAITHHAAVRFTVKDTGPGIDESHLPHLTEHFYRVDAEASRRKNGTGLGLTIVKYVLAEHDSALEVVATPEKGSEFFCRFDLVDPPVLLDESMA